jgi:hypothetical protein
MRCELKKTYLMVDACELSVALASGSAVNILSSQGVTEFDPGGHDELGGCLLEDLCQLGIRLGAQTVIKNMGCAGELGGPTMKEAGKSCFFLLGNLRQVQLGAPEVAWPLLDDV